MTARDPMPVGTRVRWNDSTYEYAVWSLHKKPGWRWIVREGGMPTEAKMTSLTVIGPPVPSPVNEYPVAPARDTDPATSKAAAKTYKVTRGNQRHTLLECYGDLALTDYEAALGAALANTRACWWKRCSELREGGYIEVVGTKVDTGTGALVQTCAITDKGRAALRD